MSAVFYQWPILMLSSATWHHHEHHDQPILAVGRPQYSWPGKPSFKPELLWGRQPNVPQLFKFVGMSSWLLSHLLNNHVVRWMQQSWFRLWNSGHIITEFLPRLAERTNTNGLCRLVIFMETDYPPCWIVMADFPPAQTNFTHIW